MQVVNGKKERCSRRKAELQQEKSELEQRVQRQAEQLKNACLQLEVSCLHRAMCISSIVTQSNSVCVRADSVFAVSADHEL